MGSDVVNRREYDPQPQWDERTRASTACAQARCVYVEEAVASHPGHVDVECALLSSPLSFLATLGASAKYGVSLYRELACLARM